MKKLLIVWRKQEPQRQEPQRTGRCEPFKTQHSHSQEQFIFLFVYVKAAPWLGRTQLNTKVTCQECLTQLLIIPLETPDECQTVKDSPLQLRTYIDFHVHMKLQTPGMKHSLLGLFPKDDIFGKVSSYSEVSKNLTGTPFHSFPISFHLHILKICISAYHCL